MGTSRSFAELASKMDRLAADWGATVPRATGAAALKAKEVFLASAAIAVGPDLRMRGVGRAGAKLGVKYTVTPRGVSGAEARLNAVGPWHLVERRVAPHAITSRYAGGSRASRGRQVLGAGVAGPTFGGAKLGGASVSDRDARAVILTPYGYRAWVKHPGTSREKRPWAHGAATVRPLIPKFYDDALNRELARNIGGIGRL